MKNLLMIVSLLVGSLSQAATVSEVVNRVELENNAKCIKKSQSMNFCLNHFCKSRQKFFCDSNEGTFTLKLKVKEVKLANGTIKQDVTKVKIIK
ncbi:MAG: hypothetical protein N4A33_03255 [Bacteriovoracaceae bacterium]|nr:hypothetical protein [Bacteriovoracaceae bacterium]